MGLLAAVRLRASGTPRSLTLIPIRTAGSEKYPWGCLSGILEKAVYFYIWYFLYLYCPPLHLYCYGAVVILRDINWHIKLWNVFLFVGLIACFTFCGRIKKIDYHSAGLYACVFQTEPEVNATIEVKGKEVWLTDYCICYPSCITCIFLGILCSSPIIILFLLVLPHVVAYKHSENANEKDKAVLICVSHGYPLPTDWSWYKLSEDESKQVIKVCCKNMRLVPGHAIWRLDKVAKVC